ncbi:hypothetical protein LXL04_033746 [Taraxacum kok-saghyz]
MGYSSEVWWSYLVGVVRVYMLGQEAKMKSPIRVMGYLRDAPATVLFGEWFRFGKPSDQIFLFEKTIFLVASASGITGSDTTFEISDPSAVIPKLSPDSAPTELLGFDAKKQDPMLMDIGTQKMTTLPTDDKMNKVPLSIEKFLPRYPDVTSVYM